MKKVSASDGIEKRFLLGIGLKKLPFVKKLQFDMEKEHEI
jgi:hypothetical protein